MRKLFKERKLFKGGNYMRKYGTLIYAPDLNDKKENLCLHRVACKKNKGVTNHKNLIRAFEPDGNTKNEY